ncbi:thiolase family protein [Streptomyces sp. NPDC047453]|uniref:thiolase family protein n=1 Tax=Streptomyces sp. NPDC047453 TaxID=3154812 RepID=UPI0033FD7525
MNEAVVVSAVRTPVGTAFKGTLRETGADELARQVLLACVERSGVAPEAVDDVILAESLAGGGVLARHAAVAAGMLSVPGQAVNRHCAGSLTALGNAAGAVRGGAARAVVAGGTESASTAPALEWREPGSDRTRTGMGPTFPHYDGANDDVTLTVGWSAARETGLSRQELDAWALRSHRRAVAAIDEGLFADELVPLTVTLGGEQVVFDQDEHPRRGTSMEKLAALKPVHPEIEGFSVTAGNASGINDAAAALMVVSAEYAREHGLEPLARIHGWGAVGVEPHRTGMAAAEVITKLLTRSSLSAGDIALWEINEAFASVPLAASRVHGIDEEKINIHGSGCSLGHPIAASGARMVTTLVHALRRRGGGLGMAAMCAGGGMGGAVVVEV